jgi:hypothetical protein
MTNEEIILNYFRQYGPKSMRHAKIYASRLFKINEYDTHRTIWYLIDDNKLFITSDSKINVVGD